MGLLVLSRHVDEVIKIGDDIRVIVVDIRGDKVRIGVEAPNHIAVHRLEVYEAIRKGASATHGDEAKSVYGVVLQPLHADGKRLCTVVESSSAALALSLAKDHISTSLYLPDRMTVQCFGPASAEARDRAGAWMFAKWVDRHEIVRVA